MDDIEVQPTWKIADDTQKSFEEQDETDMSVATEKPKEQILMVGFDDNDVAKQKRFEAIRQKKLQQMEERKRQ